MPGQGHTIPVSGDKGKDVTFTVSGRVALDNLESFISETQARLQEMIPAHLTVDLEARLHRLNSLSILSRLTWHGCRYKFIR